MMNLFLSPDDARIDVNNTRSIGSIIYLAVVGVCVFIIQPGFVQGLVESLGLSPEQAGYIASAEMWGLAFTTIMLNFFAHRVDWQKLTFWFLLVAVIGNLASIGQRDVVTLGVIRAITGLGLGGMISLPFAMMGLTSNPDRNFGYIVVWVLIYGALGLFAIPMALQLVALDGVLVFLALFCGLGLLLIRNLPRRADDHVEAGELTDHFSLAIKGSTLTAILLFNTAIGIAWAYVFLVGTNASLSEQSVANVLTISQFLGVAGAFLAVILGTQFGRLLPLSVAVIGCGAGISLLLGDISYLIYSIAIYLFNFMWNVAQPYLLAVMASFADGGRMIVRGVCLQMIGFAIGPYIGANLLANEGPQMYQSVYLVGAALFVASWVFLLPALRAQKVES
ncbi:MAG: MFS transporter [Halieaceae bacterium]|jgi:predicted MFS family arabinose efflux permease|nr:MFS transporter [Halieaceae bacterium]